MKSKPNTCLTLG